MREAIVAAATRCIIERGHAALSTRAVAAAAGVNQSLIHYYFGTRERLMLAVLEQMNCACASSGAAVPAAPAGLRCAGLGA
jgi:AcrR family transcriptional regulator